MKKRLKSKANTGDNTLYCSFCAKSQHEAEKLIVGPTVFICDECVVLCLDIILSERPEPKGKKDKLIEKLNTFTALFFDKHEAVINELILKGNCGSFENLVYDFLRHAIMSHNSLTESGGDREPIDVELLELPRSKSAT